VKTVKEEEEEEETAKRGETRGRKDKNGFSESWPWSPDRYLPGRVVDVASSAMPPVIPRPASSRQSPI